MRSRVLWSLALTAAACIWTPNGGAGTTGQVQAEAELASLYAPVVRLKAQEQECGAGEPYEPVDVALILGNEEVALRGPWDTPNVVEVGPTASSLSTGKRDYHLDYPGNALDPGCDYEKWSKRLTADKPVTVYARVVTEDGRPDKLALQYWFFYPYNDFNNKHEGDWEMIQLLFDANDPQEASARHPVAVGYSQHEGAERAVWGASKLEIVDGTHPVVYPASGSHANYFEPALFLGRSAAQGIGCDDTTGPSRDPAVTVAVVPEEPDDYLREYPWLGYEGRWGEKQPVFYNGPTGPNMKTQWTMPVTWAETKWRDRSFAVPAGGSLGPSATQFFCTAIAWGSNVLIWITRNGLSVGLFLGGLVLVLLWAASRTSWEPSTPLRLTRLRTWGQVVSASWRMYRSHIGLFIAIGLLFVPVFAFVTLLQWIVFRITSLDALLESAGESNGFVVTLALGLGLVFTFLALGVVQAATARAMTEIDAGRQITAVRAYQELRTNLATLVKGLLRALVVLAVLSVTVLGIPLAIWLLVRWSLLAQVVELDERSDNRPLRRSAELMRGRWFWVATIMVVVGGLGLLAGPLLGVGLLFVTDATFDVVNLIASVVWAVALPFVAIATTYVYYDLRVRERLGPADAKTGDVLPAEL